jgi:thiamine pyrophosphokinase
VSSPEPADARGGSQRGRPSERGASADGGSGRTQPRWAVIVADGDGVDRALPDVLATLPSDRLVVAADGGARGALAAGVRPDLVVGDGDSLDAATRAALREAGVQVDLVAPDKDESDTELCVRACVTRGVTAIRIVGALGGDRLEHAVANLLLLAHPMLDGVDAAIVEERTTVRRVGSEGGPGALVIEGAAGDHVSLLAVDSCVEGVRTHDLRFPLVDEPLFPGPARGLSNELLGTSARVTTRRGRLLVIHTPMHPREVTS